MVIQVKHNGKNFFVQAQNVRKNPTVTPFKEKAWKFKDLKSCQNVRDDVLEFYPKNVTIVA